MTNKNFRDALLRTARAVWRMECYLEESKSIWLLSIVFTYYKDWRKLWRLSDE